MSAQKAEIRPASSKWKTSAPIELSPLATVSVSNEDHRMGVVRKDVMHLDVEGLEARDHSMKKGERRFLATLRAGDCAPTRNRPHDVVGKRIRDSVHVAAAPHLVQRADSRGIGVLGHDLPCSRAWQESITLDAQTSEGSSGG